MKYFIILVLFLNTFSQVSFAQKIELLNSGELMKKGAMLYDSGEYKKALPLYNKISRNDTNYVWALYDKALTCEADSQFNQALKYCKEALLLKEQREYEPDLYNIYGNILHDLGQPDEALNVFDLAIAKYPAYSLLYFNKGVVYLALNRFNEAELMFQKALTINPYAYSAHYQLGIAALRQGKIIPSFLSLIGYLLVNPNGKYSVNAIKLLNQISKGTNEILDYKNKRAVAPDESYQAVEEIVLSKIALDKQYKPIIALDDAISRQIQAVFEKLEYNQTNKDFWIQYYLPYFKQIYNDHKFELLINHIFSSAKIAIIQDYNKKNKKELERFISDGSAYFDLIRSTRELFYNKRDSVIQRYYFTNGQLVGKGVLVNNGKTLNGFWNFYYPGGNIKQRGDYNTKGEREGEAVFYFTSGKLKAKERYINGKLEGKQEYYFENGNLSSIENYKNGQLDSLSTTFYYAGSLKSEGNYKLGKKDGIERDYYSNGNLYSSNNYINGILTGVSHEYYKSGGVKDVEQYTNGKAEGEYKSYYEGGALSTIGQFVNGNAQSEWKYYYENGKIKEKRNYINNLEDGVREEYYESGKMSGTSVLKKDKINGNAVYYFEDGKVLAEHVYDNGIIKAAKYLDKSGLEISSSRMMNNVISVVSYGVDGLKKEYFSYDKKGNLIGADTVFYPSGKIKQLNVYKNGELNGPTVSYYLNGKKKSEVNMTDGKEDGYYTGFYLNGQPEVEGWMQGGKAQGEWNYYDELGRLSAKSYFQDNDPSGYKEDYLPNGQKKLEQKYHLGWLEKIVQFDNDGKVMAVDSFPKATGKYTLMYPNGHVMTEGNYTNGDFNGPYKTYYFDGSPETIFFYKKGVLDSTYTSFYYGGTKKMQGSYKFGNKTGIWKSYDEDGKLHRTIAYANDLKNGEEITYFPNGNKEIISQYKDDLLNGFSYNYDADGALGHQIIFETDKAKSYTYLGNDGKLLPYTAITITNGTLKTYYQNGKLSRECSYSDGIKNGQDIIYYHNGQIKSILNTVYGIYDGISKEFYQNGKLKSEYNYAVDNVTGTCKEFDETGVLKKELVFDNGLKHGPAKYYDATGKPSKTMWYNYGTLTSVKNEK